MCVMFCFASRWSELLFEGKIGCPDSCVLKTSMPRFHSLVESLLLLCRAWNCATHVLDHGQHGPKDMAWGDLRMSTLYYGGVRLY